VQQSLLSRCPYDLRCFSSWKNVAFCRYSRQRHCAGMALFQPVPAARCAIMRAPSGFIFPGAQKVHRARHHLHCPFRPPVLRTYQFDTGRRSLCRRWKTGKAPGDEPITGYAGSVEVQPVVISRFRLLSLSRGR
jgi:hypothetical protein